jgi:hypothetical protein
MVGIDAFAARFLGQDAGYGICGRGRVKRSVKLKFTENSVWSYLLMSVTVVMLAVNLFAQIIPSL